MGQRTGKWRAVAVLVAICTVLLAGCAPAQRGGELELTLTGYGAVSGGSILDILPEEEDTRPQASDINLFGAGGGAVSGTDQNIGVCIYESTDSFMARYSAELVGLLTEAGATVTLYDAANYQATQISQIETLIAQGCDVLIVNPVQADYVPDITDLCHSAGVPVVYIAREPWADEQARWAAEGIQATYVGVDPAQAGRMQGEMVVDLANRGDINGDGKVSYVMIKGDWDHLDARLRTEHAVGALVDAGITVDMLFEGYGDWDAANARDFMEAVLAARYSADLEVIFCNNDAMAIGAMEAIEAYGFTVGEDVYLLGIDAMAGALEFVRDGRMTGTVFNDYAAQARTAAQLALTLADGGSVQTRYTVDFVKVTRDNAADILAMMS